MKIALMHTLSTLLCLAILGCDSTPPGDQAESAVQSSQLESLREQYISSEPLESTITIPRLRKKLTPKEVIEGEDPPAPPPESLEVIVVGKICEKKSLADNPDFPWQPGKAAFMMIDPDFEPSSHAEEHGDGEECPFCLKKENDAQALVQLIDENGEVLSADARELLSITEGQQVTVSGVASLLADILMIDVDSVHVAR